MSRSSSRHMLYKIAHCASYTMSLRSSLSIIILDNFFYSATVISRKLTSLPRLLMYIFMTVLMNLLFIAFNAAFLSIA